ncbi:MAG: metal ABC transporter substrate-binding protein, partial [Actinomycetota bacterium]
MRRSLAVLATLSLLVPACERSDDGLRVVAALYPLAWVAERVGGPWVAVEDLTPAGVEAHDATLSASQRADLQAADVVLLIGTGGFQPDVARAAAEARGRVIDVAAGLDLIPSTDPLPVDPHLWLDPSLLAQAVDAGGEEVSPSHPPHTHPPLEEPPPPPKGFSPPP